MSGNNKNGRSRKKWEKLAVFEVEYGPDDYKRKAALEVRVLPLSTPRYSFHVYDPARSGAVSRFIRWEEDEEGDVFGAIDDMFDRAAEVIEEDRQKRLAERDAQKQLPSSHRSAPRRGAPRQPPMKPKGLKQWAKHDKQKWLAKKERERNAPAEVADE